MSDTVGKVNFVFLFSYLKFHMYALITHYSQLFAGLWSHGMPNKLLAQK